MARKFSPIVALALVFAIFYEPDNFDPESIAGKRVLVTGSSSGIGEAMAYEYSRLGASIVLTARRTELLKAVAAKCKELGARSVAFVTADMSRPEDRERLVRKVHERFGGRLDHLILNHAATRPAHWNGSDDDMARLHYDMEVNFVSFVDVASRCRPMLDATGSGGRVGVISSLAGRIGMPQYTSYVADKQALHGFFSSWRQELSQSESDVSVTLFVLGMIDTARAPIATDKLPSFLATALTPASVDDTAVAIVKGVSKGAYEVVYPRSAKFILFLNKIVPGYVEKYVASLIVDVTELPTTP